MNHTTSLQLDTQAPGTGISHDPGLTVSKVRANSALPKFCPEPGSAPIKVLEEEGADVRELGLHVVHQLNDGALPEERHQPGLVSESAFRLFVKSTQTSVPAAEIATAGV